jgi:hypothetical protein
VLFCDYLNTLQHHCLITSQHVDNLRKCCNVLMEEAEDSLGVDGGAGGALLSAVEPKLNAFTQAVERVIRSARAGSMGDYKVQYSTVMQQCLRSCCCAVPHAVFVCIYVFLCMFLSLYAPV